MTTPLRWGACVLSTYMLFCTGTDEIAGGGGHEGEARVSGRVVYADTGTVPWGAAVYLRSKLFTKDPATAEKSPVPDAVIGPDGGFAIDSVDAVEYTIELNDGKNSGACIRFAVAKDSAEVNLPKDTLRRTGTIRGKLVLDSIGTVPLFVQIYGLDRTAKIDEKTDSFTLDDIPAGTYALHIMSTTNLSIPENIDGVHVQPGGTTGLSLVYRSIDSLNARKLRVYLNTSSTGAATTAPVYDFPVLVRLNADNFDFGEARSNGGDIRFVKSSGAPLPFEIEAWDSKLQQASIWVRVDTILGNNATQSFLMRWGGADTSKPATLPVFDTSRGFLANYHLCGTLADATPHGHNGIDSGSTDTANGIIGRARAFNGSSQFFSVGDLPDREQGSISCWFRLKTTMSPSASSTQGIWGKRESDSIDYTLSFRGPDFYIDPDIEVKGRLFSKLETPDTGYYLTSTTGTFNADTWYFASWSWGNGGDSLYVNGTLEASMPRSLKMTGTGIEEIGRSHYDSKNSTTSPKYFGGLLDEFRIDNTCRSADWIKLCYMNQRKDDKLVVIGE